MGGQEMACELPTIPMAVPPHPWSPRNLCPLLRKQDLHVQTGRSRLALGKRHLNSPRRNWSCWKNPACLQRGKRDMGVLTSVCSRVGDRLMAQLCWPGAQDGTWAPSGRTAQAEQAPVAFLTGPAGMRGGGWRGCRGGEGVFRIG